jgi:hypothetical protein
MHPFSYVDGHRKPVHADAALPARVDRAHGKYPGMPRVGGVT